MRTKLVLILTLVSTFAVVVAAWALPKQMVEMTYYFDPGFSDQAGFQVTVRCNGTMGPLFGEVAEYSMELKTDCREQTFIDTCYWNVWRVYPDGHRELEFRSEIPCPDSI